MRKPQVRAPLSSGGRLEKEIETWKGFPWALRKDDVEAWNRMVGQVRKKFAGAIEESERTFTTDAFFLALILVQQEMIGELRAQLGVLEADPQARQTPQLDL